MATAGGLSFRNNTGMLFVAYKSGFGFSEKKFNQAEHSRIQETI